MVIVSPFSYANAYRKAGFKGTLPVPLKTKTPPPAGFTGKHDRWPTDKEIADWSNTEQNIVLRLPKGIIGIDVDDYAEKNGAATLTELENTHGQLPKTVRCSSRDDNVSGIYLFRVPEDLGKVGDLGPGIEVIHYEWRYLVAAPSIHPSGAVYKWKNSENLPVTPPVISEIPYLPEQWVEWLRTRKATDPVPLEPIAHEPLTGDAIVAARVYSEKYVAAKLKKLAELPSKGYSAQWDTTTFGVARDLVKLSNAWWSGTEQTVLHEKYVEACQALKDGSEWDSRMLGKWERAIEEEKDSVPLPPEVLRVVRGRIELNATNEADFEERVSTIIGTGPLSSIFRRGSELVRFPSVSESGYNPPIEEDDSPIFSRVSKGNLPAILDETFWVYRWNGSGEAMERVHSMSPARAVERVIERSTPGIRTIKTLTRTPLVRLDGSLLSEPGYDATSKALYIPRFATNLETFVWDSAQAAREYLLSETSDGGLFGQLPWDGPENGNDSRATYLAMLLTPLVELMCPSPWPLFAVSAPDRGSGKSMLTQCASILYGGSVRGMSHDRERFSQDVTTALLDTDGKIVTFDNIERVVANDDLSRLLTEPVWSARLLGGNKNSSLPNDRMWCVTGNNIEIGADQRRRTMWILLDAKVEKPWERVDFRDKQLKQTVTQNWLKVASALAEMVIEWIAAGCPPAADQEERFDEYGNWLRTINGILAFSGASGRVGRSERTAGLIENDAWASLYEVIWQEFGNSKWSVKKLTQTFKLQPFIENAIDGAGKTDRAASTRLGNAIGKRENQVIGGFKIIDAGKYQGAKQWQMESMDNATPPEQEAAKSDSELGLDFDKFMEM